MTSQDIWVIARPPNFHFNHQIYASKEGCRRRYLASWQQQCWGDERRVYSITEHMLLGTHWVWILKALFGT